MSDVHGTTRDTIEDTIDIKGITFRFIDTAGIRQTQDEVEQIGITRTYAAIDKARIVLWLIDSEPSIKEINDILQRTDNKKLIVIKNKADKADSNSYNSLKLPFISISAKFGKGIEELEQAIYEAADIPTLTENDIIVTNVRSHRWSTDAVKR